MVVEAGGDDLEDPEEETRLRLHYKTAISTRE